MSHKTRRRFLLIHNFYFEAGGEDTVYRSESTLLESYGHKVLHLERENYAIAAMRSASLAASTIWNQESYREVQNLVRNEGIELVHFHNTLPLISPSAYYAARAAGAAVVQTLHNYRLVCVNAKLYRDDAPCEDCVGRAVPWPGVLHRCYRGSLSASGGVAAMLSIHRLRGTWTGRVDRYIALTEFAKRKFVAGGIPEDLIAVKPNFVEAPAAQHSGGTRSGFLYVGRVTAEKGLRPLVAASRRAGAEVRIVGEGPLSLPAPPANVTCLGAQPKEAVRAQMNTSLALVFPSLWYEGFPLVIAEAFAASLPVIASRIGGIPEIVEDGVTGLLVAPGDEVELAEKMTWATAHPEAMAEMGRNARRVYEEKYTPERNYAMLMEIYEAAIAHARARGVTRPAGAPAAP